MFAAASVSAQTRSSFLAVDGFSDVFVTPSNGGLTYAVSLGANPQMFFQSQVYAITDVFGFWVLKNEDPNTLSSSNSSFGVWSVWNASSGPGEIAGWKTNPNTGITPGGSVTFNFSALNVAEVDQFGFHVRLNGTFPGTNGDTGYATVPEPSALAALGLGLLSLPRRRKLRSP